jgi:hypothetical protein
LKSARAKIRLSALCAATSKYLTAREKTQLFSPQMTRKSQLNFLKRRKNITICKTKGAKMNKIDRARKLTSRKFWAAIIGFVTPFLVTSGHSSEQVTQITAMIMSGAAVVAYIVASARD